jgi:hypothetical protein
VLDLAVAAQALLTRAEIWVPVGTQAVGQGLAEMDAKRLQTAGRAVGAWLSPRVTNKQSAGVWHSLWSRHPIQGSLGPRVPVPAQCVRVYRLVANPRESGAVRYVCAGFSVGAPVSSSPARSSRTLSR